MLDLRIHLWGYMGNLSEFTHQIVRLLAKQNGIACIVGVHEKVTELGVNLAEEILVKVFQHAKAVLAAIRVLQVYYMGKVCEFCLLRWIHSSCNRLLRYPGPIHKASPYVLSRP